MRIVAWRRRLPPFVPLVPERPHASVDRACSSAPRRPPPYWLRRMALILRRSSSARLHPFRARAGDDVTTFAIHLRLGVLARATAHGLPKQSVRVGTPGDTSMPPARPVLAAVGASSTPRLATGPIPTGASHEVCFPSAHTSRVARSRVAAMPAGQSRFGVRRRRSRAACGIDPGAIALAVFRCRGSDLVSLVGAGPSSGSGRSLD